MKTARVRNWAEFQHYKDRSPPWIKLHRRLLDNMDYHLLRPESAKALPLIWIIASENDGYIPAFDELAFRLRTTPEAAQAICDDLIARNFLDAAHAEHVATQNQQAQKNAWPSRHIPNKVRIEVFQRDSGCCVWCGSDENIEFDHVTPVSKGGESIASNLQLLCRSCNRKKRTRDAAQSEQLATQIQGSRSLETEGEGETEADIPVANATGSGSDGTLPAAVDEMEVAKGKRQPCPFVEIVAAYHESLPAHPRVEKLTDARRGLIRQRWLQDLPTLEAWRNYFADVAASKFLTGRTEPRPGKPPFIADLEWLCRPSSFAKVAEGKYHR